MSTIPRNTYTETTEVDQTLKDIVLEDIVNNDYYDESTKLGLLAILIAIKDELSDVCIRTLPGLPKELGTN
jgi:hypothetical protein